MKNQWFYIQKWRKSREEREKKEKLDKKNLTNSQIVIHY